MLSMSFPFTLILLACVSSAAVAVAWTATLVLHRKSAALRHFIWLLALAVPLAAAVLAVMNLRLSIPILPVVRAPMASTDFGQRSQPILPLLLASDGDQKLAAHPRSGSGVERIKLTLPFNPWIAAWLCGVILFIARIGGSQIRVRFLIRTGCSPGPEELMARLDKAKQRFRFFHSVRLLVTSSTEIPFCCGIFRPTIIFPESWREWDDEKIDVCLTHEMAHLVRRDLQSMALAQASCLLCWFNPLVWFAAGRLRDEAEKAADDGVLSKNFRPESYASNLVALTEKYRASALSPAIALSMARPNRLKARVEAILDATVLRNTPGLKVILSTSLLALMVLVIGMSVRLTAAPALVSNNAAPLATSTAAAPHHQSVSKEPAASAHEALDNALIQAARAPAFEFAGVGKTQEENRADVEKLLQQGADPNAKDKSGNTALIYALNFGNDEVAQTLIEHGADGNIEDKSGENAAWLAASLFYCPNALELMIKKGVKVTGVDKGGGNILHHMSTGGPLGPSHPSFFGGVAYSEERQKAYEARERRTVDLLVAAGVDLNARNNSQDGRFQTPLMHLLQTHHLEAARALIDHGANLTLEDARGNTAFGYLFPWESSVPPPTDIIESMLARGIDANSTVIPPGDGDGPAAIPAMGMVLATWPSKTPDEIAALRKTVGSFLSHGAIFPKVSDDQAQALLKAAAQGDLKSMQDIVRQGTSIDSASGNGWTPLALSVALGYTDNAEWLLNQGADGTRHVDKYFSPLSLAAKGGQTDVVNTLIAKGPKPNPDATHALVEAVENNDQPMFDALIKAGANPKSVFLFSCIKKGEVAMARTALDAGANPNPSPNGADASLVYWAVYYNQPEILKALLDHGANPLTTGNMGQTPLALAQKNHPNLVPILEEAIKRRQTGASAGSVNPASVTLSTPFPKPTLTLTDVESGKQKLERKIHSIVIDKVNLDHTDIADVVQLLTVKSKEFDPEHVGINFVLNLSSLPPPPGLSGDKGLKAAAPFTATPPEGVSSTLPPVATANKEPNPAPTVPIHRTVTIHLENVPISDVLGYVVQQTGLEYSLDDYAVYLRPPANAGEALTVRTFLAPAGFIKLAAASGGTPPPIPVLGDLGSAGMINVRDQLANRGIQFPADSTAVFLPASRKLIIRDTPEQLDLVANLIEQMSTSYHSPAPNPKSVLFDQLDFDRVDVRAVLQVLSDKSKNSNKKRIYFRLRLSFQPLDKPGEESPVDPRIHPKVTLKATNISLADALDRIAAQTGLEYNIGQWDYNGNREVFLEPPVENSDTFAVRTYWTPPNFISGQYPDAAPATGEEFRKIDVKDELKNRGLLFPDGASATLLTKFKRPILGDGKLVVRNTLKQLDLLAILLDHASEDDRKSVEIKYTSSFSPY